MDTKPKFVLDQLKLTYFIGLVILISGASSIFSQYNQIADSVEDHVELRFDFEKFVEITFEDFKTWLSKEFEKRETKAILYIDNVVMRLKEEINGVKKRQQTKINQQNGLIKEVNQLRIDVAVLQNEIEHLKK